MALKLLSPVVVGTQTLSNRVVMAPLTRCRTAEPNNVMTDLNRVYYEQRCSAGLIISEALTIDKTAQGYAGSPGIYTDAQESSWKKIVDAIHERGSKISAQLWHVGRISHTCFHGGKPPLAPSSILATNSRCRAVGENGEAIGVSCSMPREMNQNDIKTVIKQYVSSAKRSLRAGFDFVEEHAANGYLLQQFQAKSANRRTDQYGGSLENRARLTLEVLDALIDAVGSNRLGIRLSPYFNIHGIDDDEMEDMALYILRACEAKKVAYVSVAEPNWVGGVTLSESFKKQIRQTYSGFIFYAGNYTAQSAEQALLSGYADAIAFGRPYIANPDLVERIKVGASFNKVDEATIYGGGEKGYTDYPFLS